MQNELRVLLLKHTRHPDKVQITTMSGASNTSNSEIVGEKMKLLLWFL